MPRWTTGTAALLLLACEPTPTVPELAPLPAPTAEEAAATDAGFDREGLSEGEAAFHTMMDALTSPRCVNCHPSDGAPKQTDRARPHLFGVRGGPENHGTEALTCGTCHQPSNNLHSGVPGAPHWSLAPASMAWEGLSREAIARSMMNPESNGNRTPEDILHHLTEHELVLWAWEPGADASGAPRQPPPVPLETYQAAVRTWIAAGAPLPGGERLAPPGEDHDASDEAGSEHE
jgi:hypothetical protein